VFFGLNFVKTANILVFSLGCFVKQEELPGFKNKLSFIGYLSMMYFNKNEFQDSKKLFKIHNINSLSV